MPGIRVRTTITFGMGAEEMSKAARPSARAGLQKALEKRQTFLSRHFSRRARYRYNHEPRSARYNQRKVKLATKRSLTGRILRISPDAAVGDRPVDMVWTGDLKNALLHQSRIQVSQRKEPIGRIIYTGARALNFSGMAGRPDMRTEINTDTPDELQQVMTAAHNEFKRQMKTRSRRQGRRVLRR